MIGRSRVRSPAEAYRVTTLGKLFTHMYPCPQSSSWDQLRLGQVHHRGGVGCRLPAGWTLRLAADWRLSSTSHTCVMPLYTSLRCVRRWIKTVIYLLFIIIYLEQCRTHQHLYHAPCFTGARCVLVPQSRLLFQVLVKDVYHAPSCPASVVHGKDVWRQRAKLERCRTHQHLTTPPASLVHGACWFHRVSYCSRY